MAERFQAHRQARVAWWLVLAPTVSAALLVVAALLSASTVRFDLPSADQLVDACRTLIPPIGVRTGVELLAGGAGLAMASRAASCAIVEVRGLRRYQAAVASSRPTRVGTTEVWIVDDDRRLAFTGGWLRPRIHISTATQRSLATDALTAVVAHEQQHRRKRDPLRMAVIRVASETLAFIPGLVALAHRHARSIELAADEAAAHLTSTKAIAGALLRLGQSGLDEPYPEVCGIAPERVDRLAGRATSPLPFRQAGMLLFGAVVLGLFAVESIESARTAPIQLAVAAAQLCSAGGLGLAFAVLVAARHRRSSALTASATPAALD